MPPPLRINDNDYHFHAYDYTGSAAPWTPSPAQPHRYGWEFYSMVQDLQGLQAFGNARGVPNIALQNIGAPTNENRNVMALSFGNNAANTPRVLITGGLHAREWIAPEIAYLVAEYLVMHYTAAPHNRHEQAIHNLVHSRWIHFIPMVNPDGNWHTVFGSDRMWRRNRRPLPATAAHWVAALCPLGPLLPNWPFINVQVGWWGWGWAEYDVPDYDPANGIPPGAAHYRTRSLTNRLIGVDLNRNYATAAWGYDCAPDYNDYDPRSDTYFGPDNSSEMETADVAQYLQVTARPQTSIDYHSYGQLILYPTEVSNNGLVGPDYQWLGAALQQLVRAEAAVDYRLGTPMQLLHYDGAGTIIDHIAQRHNARAFTIELDPPIGSDRDDDSGFLLPETSIRTVFEKNIRGALAAVAAPPPGTPNWAFNPAVYQFLGWNVYGRGNRLPV